MRIIAGRLRRRTLHAPTGNQTRPSTDRTREAIFNLVASRIDLEDADVLDLFAGTGALGLEAVSRGAQVATFVELDAAVLKVARRNADTLGVADSAVFVRADAVAYVRRYSGPPYSLILADPPYDLKDLAALPDLALPHVREDGLFVLEHDIHDSFDSHPHLETSRAYGKTVVSIFSPSPLDP